jgi:hypothetical protein
MDLISALKTGKRIKLKEWAGFITPFDSNSFQVKEILRTDWEIEEKTITISESQFMNCWSNAMKLTETDPSFNSYGQSQYLFSSKFISYLKKELGF